MGAAIDAIGTTVDVLRRNPALLGAALLVAALSTASNVSSQVVPLVGGLVGLLFFFVEPFLAAGFIGMANEAVDGATDFSTFVGQGKDKYLTLLGARLLVVVAVVAYTVLLALLVVFVVGVGASGLEPGAGGDPSALVGAAGVAVIGLFLVSGLVAVVAGFLVQFHPAAIVMADAGLVESFRYSYRIVVDDPLSVLGYSLVAVLFGVVVGAATLLVGGGGAAATLMAAGDAAATPEAGPAAGVAVFAVVSLLGSFLSVALGRTYYVSFVRSVTDTA